MLNRVFSRNIALIIFKELTRSKTIIIQPVKSISVSKQ